MKYCLRVIDWKEERNLLRLSLALSFFFIETKCPSKSPDWKTLKVRNQHTNSNNDDDHSDIFLLKPQMDPVLTRRVKAK